MLLCTQACGRRSGNAEHCLSDETLIAFTPFMNKCDFCSNNGLCYTVAQHPLYNGTLKSSGRQRFLYKPHRLASAAPGERDASPAMACTSCEPQHRGLDMCGNK